MDAVLKSTRPAVSSQALAGWLALSWESMLDSEKNARLKSATRAELAGATLKAAIAKHWLATGKNMTQLADAAKCRLPSIYGQYAGFSDDPAKRAVANKLGATIGIDVDALFDGKIKLVSSKPTETARLVSLAERLSKTSRAGEAEHILEVLLDAAEATDLKR